MINEFSSSPKPQNKNAPIACAVSMLLFAALAVVYMLVDSYKGVVGLAAIILLTAGIYIYTKYISVKYYYDITKDSEGNGLFVVRRAVGKRQTTMYMTHLSHIIDVRFQTKEERCEKGSKSGFVKHYFTPTLMPGITCAVTVRTRFEKSVLIIECTEEFAKLISTYAKEEQERTKLQDDEY